VHQFDASILLSFTAKTFTYTVGQEKALGLIEPLAELSELGRGFAIEVETVLAGDQVRRLAKAGGC
jgi:hypothetical protein